MRRATAAGAEVLVLGLLLLWSVGCTAASKPVPADGQDADTGGYLSGVSLLVPYTMPDQTLTDTSGHAYNVRSSPSRPVTLVFFGYTHCPDVCLGVLSEVATALSRMPDAARDQVQMLYITTDPARDTPQVMGSYLAHIDGSFIGLTGDQTTIRAVADQVGVDILGTKRLPDGGYEVSHTAQLTGFDKEHRGVVRWTPSTPIGNLTRDVELLVARQQ